MLYALYVVFKEQMTVLCFEYDTVLRIFVKQIICNTILLTQKNQIFFSIQIQKYRMLFKCTENTPKPLPILIQPLKISVPYDYILKTDVRVKLKNEI